MSSVLSVKAPRDAVIVLRSLETGKDTHVLKPAETTRAISPRILRQAGWVPKSEMEEAVAKVRSEVNEERAEWEWKQRWDWRWIYGAWAARYEGPWPKEFQVWVIAREGTTGRWRSQITVRHALHNKRISFVITTNLKTRRAAQRSAERAVDYLARHLPRLSTE